MRLYAAIDAGDVASVAAAWARSPAVVYVGALRPPAVGYEAVVGAMAAEWEEGGVPVTSATNVFEAKNGEWYLIARMATPLSAAGGGAS
ncbi:hypothetical protein I4F81_012060 [Pyropia yezoensis]|uniref:Uncharacterized protein n=1 Tax=Pyropia yezoensis TaxID=2788 RepID=A0ACC3CIH9_PYRYE|nr:hypothetical protein I4F81_012060 [Neopyropia yezoensis]